MPASVLVAVLVVAGVASLLPNLVRRFDRAERADVELRDPAMRVLCRRRRRRTVPGRRPVEPPTAVLLQLGATHRLVGRVAVPGALVPGDPEADAAVRAALIAEVMDRHEARRADARTALTEEADPSRPRARSGVRARSADRSGPSPRARAVRARARRRRGGLEADPTSMRRWWRYRRRRVLVLLVVLVVGQGVGVALVGSAFWTGVGVGALLLVAYVLHLRGTAAAERRRRERLVLRRRRARILAREAALAAGVAAEVEAMVADWLAMPRQERRDPPSEEVVAVLAAGGQEVVQAGDGTWYPREIPLPLYVTAPRAPAAPSVPAAPPAAPSATPPAAAGPSRRPAAYEPPHTDDGDDGLPQAVNL